MEIKRRGSQAAYTASNDTFTGSVTVDPLFNAPSPARGRGGSVKFEPGARTAWHSHPLGQTLIVVAGCGWVQLDGSEVQEIREGDVVWIAPGERHWHGATRTTSMTHLAIQEHVDGKSVDWMDHVEDRHYGCSPSLA